MTFILTDGIRIVGPFETKREALIFREGMPDSRSMYAAVKDMKIREMKSPAEFEEKLRQTV